MPNDKILRMEQLVRELNEASDAYYNGRSEQMTDYEWDQRFDELKALENETGTTLPDSPTQKVSEDTITGQKEEHEFAALSLAKTKQVSDLVKWAEERPIWISWKLDGLTLVVTYDNGKLTKVVTRGNGHIGTNITHLARSINGIPQTIDYQGHTVIRGEAVISYDDFERFLMESGEDYANPRNLASGSLTLKDPDEVRQRHIQWIPFTLVYIDNSQLSTLNFQLNSWPKVSKQSSANWSNIPTKVRWKPVWLASPPKSPPARTPSPSMASWCATTIPIMPRRVPSQVITPPAQDWPSSGRTNRLTQY